MNDSSALNYRSYLAGSLKKHSVRIADLWLARLEDVVNESTRDIFPTEQYLDHIPSMIDEIGEIMTFSDEDLALTNSLIERKADQLGTLRHQQRATVNQLLREYDLLAKVLEEFIVEQAANYPGEISAEESIRIMASIARIVRSILQSTVDSFVERYMTTIKDQTDKILSFNTFISHELKTPLQAAQLNMELLMENKDLSADDAKDLLLIQTSVQQASQLLKNIENLIDNSDPPMQDTPTHQLIDLGALLRDVLNQMEETAETREVKFDIQADLGELIADTAKLKIVFSNLVTNAIKYSDPGKPDRFVRVRSAPTQKANRLAVEVIDNGLGIDEHMQDAVFKLRVRAHETEDDRLNITGYGMGLYLVTEALRDLGGSIKLNSETGEGSRFRVELPKEPPSTRLTEKSK